MAMVIDHPTYPNPTISEALCEIHYKLLPENPWKPSLPGKLFMNIQGDFPEMEPGIDMGIEVGVGPEGITQKLVHQGQRTIFRHKTQRLLLQLSQNIFTVNVLSRYEGWQKMKKDILAAWGKACKILQPVAVTRLGLRYINTIPLESAAESADKWLLPGEYIAPSVLKSKPAFLSRNELRLNADNRLKVTLGTGKISQQMPHGFLVFDIDRISEKEIGINAEALEEGVQELHNHIWAIFKNSMTSDLEKLLSRTPQ